MNDGDYKQRIEQAYQRVFRSSETEESACLVLIDLATKFRMSKSDFSENPFKMAQSVGQRDVYEYLVSRADVSSLAMQSAAGIEPEVAHDEAPPYSPVDRNTQ